ncbi:MAG: hypothetical protein RLZZ15_3886, partial [Verrucomicrobiota bacterium]
MRTSPRLLLAALLLAALSVAARAQAPAQPAQPAPATPGSATTSPPAAADPKPVGDPALADKPAAPPKPEVTLKSEVDAKPVVTKGKDSGGQDTLSVDFPDTDIRDILRNVADLFELNIIMPETLQGKTTVKLRQVTWRQIYENVLKPANYTYVEEGNIIKIVSNESLTQEPTTTDVFLINYAKASDILPTVSSLVDATAGGKIVVDSRSNSLVITERPTRLGRIRPIIEALDRATDQVMIEAKFVEVTSGNIKNIGVNWSSLDGYRVGVSGDGKGGVV